MGFNLSGGSISASLPAAYGNTSDKPAYTYADDGRGGVNYFSYGNAITNKQYEAATGQGYNQIQSDAAARYAAANPAKTTQTNVAAPYDPTAAAAASQKAQFQAQLDQLDGQQNIGLSNIDNSYNRSANRLDEQNAAAQRDYGLQTQSNTQNYSNTRNGVISQTRAQANALQRLLGMNGAGNSSAAYEQAPYAAALQGSQGLQGAQQTFGQNQRSLDTSWGDTQRSYKNSLDDLNTQKYQQQNGLRSSIAQTRASLLSGLQGANGTSQYQGQINDLLGQITGLGQQYANPVARVSDLSFAAPDLSQYSLDGLRVGNNGQAGAGSDIAPTFLGLLNNQRDQYGNLISA